MKQYRASSASAEQKAKNNAYMKNYRATSTKNIQYFISRFHEVVSQGPVYICTCCDQLWYRHSVFSAEKLKCANPDIVKHLCNKMSVNNIEWVCRTCFTHLVKNRIPPCAIVNGMKFPEKPALAVVTLRTFALGNSVLPREILPEYTRGKFISGFIFPR